MRVSANALIEMVRMSSVALWRKIVFCSFYSKHIAKPGKDEMRRWLRGGHRIKKMFWSAYEASIVGLLAMVFHLLFRYLEVVIAIFATSKLFNVRLERVNTVFPAAV